MHLKTIDAKLLLREAINMKILLTPNELQGIDSNEYGFYCDRDREWLVGTEPFFIKRIRTNSPFRKELLTKMALSNKEPKCFSRETLEEILYEEKS